MTKIKTKKANTTQNINSEMQDKIAHLENQLKLALSDYQNLQKQTERAKQILSESVKKDIFKDLITLFSDLEIATRNIDKIDEKNPWLTGILQILSKYKDLLKTNGIQEIFFKTGDPIDFNKVLILGKQKPEEVKKMLEQNLNNINSQKQGERTLKENSNHLPELKPNTIAFTVEAGYMTPNYIIVPAKVIVISE